MTHSTDETTSSTMSDTIAMNILGTALQCCSTRPLTGFFRNGCCHAHPIDPGAHVVCTLVTDEFLQFSKAQGNDLITPRPEHDFPGLKAGDRWCFLCAMRWKLAYNAGVAPPIIAKATHQQALASIESSLLELYSL